MTELMNYYQALLDILPRDHLVDTRFGKELRPALQSALVQHIVIGAIKVGQSRTQFQSDLHPRRGGNHAGYSSMTER